jgi:PKD repeat protein
MPNTTYYYQVKAYGNGYSDPSNEANSTTPILNAPSNLQATAVSATQIDLQWDDSSNGENSFWLCRSTVSGGSCASLGVGANQEAYSDGALLPNTTYYYRVRARVGLNTYSDFSNEVNATTTVLNAPSNLQATAVSSTQIDLQWDDNSNEENSFWLCRSTVSGGSCASLGVGANQTAYSDNALLPNTTYYYRVRARVGLNTYSDFSNEVTDTTEILHAPTNLQATTVSSSQIDLSWTDNSNDETKFRVYRGTVSGTYNYSVFVAANETTYSDTTVAPNNTYFYQIRAYSTGYSDPSNEDSTTTPSLNAPTNLTARAVSPSLIELTWTDNSNDETRFYVERKTGTDGTYASIGWVNANVTSYSSTGLSNNTEYCYHVRAYNGAGYSTYSNEICATTTDQLPYIKVAPVSHDFDNVPVGGSSTAQTFVVSNIGIADLILGTISLNGADAAEYVKQNDTCSGVTLLTSDTCTFEAVFSPATQGAKGGILNIPSNDLYDNPLEIQLSGTGNTLPASVPGGPYSGTEGQSITLDGSGSTDADGTVDFYEWDTDGDGIYDYGSSSSTYSHTYAQNGTYNIKLRVTDNLEGTNEAAATADISDTSPTAGFTGSPALDPAPLTVNFSDSSTGYDQSLTYEWDFDNNGTTDSTEQNPSYSYNEGTFTVKLTVTDSDGSPDTLTMTDYITVTPPEYNLTITKTGTGFGTVTSSPAGIDCGADCTEIYVEGAAVALSAIPDAGSYLTGWSDPGCSGTGDCTVAMTADTDITATFDSCANPPVRINGTTPVYYSTLQEAYDAAVEGDVIQSQAVRFVENLDIDDTGSKYVILEGGYDCGYTNVIGKTRIKGRIKSSMGKAKGKNFKVEK